MATKTAPAPEPPDAELIDAYIRARRELDDVRRERGADEPVIETSEEETRTHIDEVRTIHPSRRAAVQAKVQRAENELRNTYGPAAVAVAKAKAQHYEAQVARRRAEMAGAGVRDASELAKLVDAEETAARLITATERHAAEQAEAYEQRCALDAQHADVLDRATAGLESARQALAAKATAAERALLDLVVAADAYRDVQQDVTEQLTALGFAEGQRHDGTAHVTVPGALLRVSGRDWVRLGGAELMMRSVLRVAEAVGERPLRDRLLGLAGIRQYAADALLGAPGLERVDRQRPASVTRLALRDVLAPVEAIARKRDGYYRDVAPKPRRITVRKAPPAA